MRATYHKRALPNSAVFDEKRVFRAGVEPMQLFEIAGVRVGMSICEDGWIAGGPVPQLTNGGAELIVNINASPYYRRKTDVREAEMRARIEESGGVRSSSPTWSEARMRSSSTVHRSCSTPMVSRLPEPDTVSKSCWSSTSRRSPVDDANTVLSRCASFGSDGSR